jgi:hypothetical protein
LVSFSKATYLKLAEKSSAVTTRSTPPVKYASGTLVPGLKIVYKIL